MWAPETGAHQSDIWLVLRCSGWIASTLSGDQSRTGPYPNQIAPSLQHATVCQHIIKFTNTMIYFGIDSEHNVWAPETGTHQSDIWLVLRCSGWIASTLSGDQSRTGPYPNQIAPSLQHATVCQHIIKFTNTMIYFGIDSEHNVWAPETGTHQSDIWLVLRCSGWIFTNEFTMFTMFSTLSDGKSIKINLLKC